MSDCSKDVSGHFKSFKLEQDSISPGGTFIILINNLIILQHWKNGKDAVWSVHIQTILTMEKMKRPVTSQMSRFTLKHKGELVPVGSG